jgi:hypothetical protein
MVDVKLKIKISQTSSQNICELTTVHAGKEPLALTGKRSHSQSETAVG